MFKMYIRERMYGADRIKTNKNKNKDIFRGNYSVVNIIIGIKSHLERGNEKFPVDYWQREKVINCC